MIEERTPTQRLGALQPLSTPIQTAPDRQHPGSNADPRPGPDVDAQPGSDADRREAELGDPGSDGWPDDEWGDDDGYPATPRRGRPAPGPGRGESRWSGQLREVAADRLPIALRARPPAVPVRAVVVVLLISAVVGVVLLAGARQTDDSSITVPARTSALRNPTARSSAPGSSLPPGPAAVPEAAGLPVGGPLVGAAGPQSGIGTGSPGGVNPTPTAQVVIDVTGRVHRPGLVRLPSGSRVWDAVLAAGGSTSGARLDRLNLARMLADGEQILVPGPNDLVVAPSGSGGGPAGAGTAPRSAGTPLDLNNATSADLDSLPGVGPVLAGRIAAWRSQHGRFSRVEELSEVQGIGEKLFATLRSLVRV